MMQYANKSFTVPVTGRPQEGCEHPWMDTRGFCVLCGATPEQVAAYFTKKATH